MSVNPVHSLLESEVSWFDGLKINRAAYADSCVGDVRLNCIHCYCVCDAFDYGLLLRIMSLLLMHCRVNLYELVMMNFFLNEHA